MPDKFARSARVFYVEGVGQVDFAAASFQVFFMQEADTFDLALEAGDNGIRQKRNAILFAPSTGSGQAF